MQLKKAEDMSPEELLAEMQRIEDRRAKRREYNRARQSALTFEQREAQRAKRAQYANESRAREAEIIRVATALTSDKAFHGPEKPVSPMTVAVLQPKGKKAKKA